MESFSSYMFYYGIQHSPSPPTRYVAASNALLLQGQLVAYGTQPFARLFCSLFKNATCTAFILIKHPISNCSCFGKEGDFAWSCQQTDPKQSSPARSSHLWKANICQKCVFISRLCHLHYPAAVYRSTGIASSLADSQNAILNFEMLRRVTEWIKTEGMDAFERMNGWRMRRGGWKKGRETQNIGGGNVVGRREERGGGGVVISQECTMKWKCGNRRYEDRGWSWRRIHY